ncbi:MAG: phenylacetate-CoA oxygenase subunit PaaJ [Crocinitomicaceae bacterium]|nr:phenylacetate-CoA oxygenase subunit PaaJ [Crocinitomicaceae bacterium]
MELDKLKIEELLEQVTDPEIPVISIRELGILRDINIENDQVEVVITPTYSGCPAMGVIKQDISKVLKEAGVDDFSVRLVLSPAWTTDWMTDDGKRKLREYGIAPPDPKSKIVPCPRCGSENTELISLFGSTACKSLYKCNDCKEPFDHFKCH